MVDKSTTIDTDATREYKNSFFRQIFSVTKAFIELLSAILGITIPKELVKSFKDLSPDSGHFTNPRNDVGFFIEKYNILALTEHQSTLNPNMPFRMLRYYCKIIDAIYDNKQLLSTKQVKIYKPVFIVLYNGTRPCPAVHKQFISDSFLPSDDLFNKNCHLDSTVDLYNINLEFNNEIMDKSPTLRGYAMLVEQIRTNLLNKCEMDEAHKKATDFCRENGILTEYLGPRFKEGFNLLFEELTNVDYIQ
ncbi:MAG: Rpn family recombination-promoting nuclease/putative transposase [Deltaproteobacteria bacterium]|jgi:hypothetical protein|nr:Rpn family recombination-promoting nuclease/putative transposase [Deltaproteobacteria bacterium]